MDKSSHVRKPAVAGSFYPRNPQTLRRDLRSYLARAAKPPHAGRPLVLIEPHAGYVYSGHVAAHGYKLIENLQIRTVAVISPSHMEYFPFVSVFGGAAYETPLGRVEVDKASAARIASADPERIKLTDSGHIHPGSYRQEHALEVQLPFLQSVLKNFRIVPIVMGDQNWNLCETLGHALAPLMTRSDFLVVVSSDLSHFHDDGTAKRMDGQFCSLMERMDAKGLYDAIRRSDCEACGAGGVVASFIASERAGSVACRVLFTANSGDVSGDRDSVVGYACAVVETTEKGDERIEEEELENTSLTPEEQGYLLDLARHRIESAVGAAGAAPAGRPTERLLEPRAAFVTLKLDGRLRGCLGIIEPRKALRDTVAEMAKAAATGDPRFYPLEKDELPGVEIEISVLSALRAVRYPSDIIVGTHGLVIESGARRGLLLPQVAEEAGWDAESFLEHACEKADLPADAWKDERTRIFVFTAEVFGAKPKGSPPAATGA
jgi:AmmeMemoRadiSam system protein B/AmmeMemoRadiSam system protein A